MLPLDMGTTTALMICGSDSCDRLLSDLMPALCGRFLWADSVPEPYTVGRLCAFPVVELSILTVGKTPVSKAR